MKWGGGTDQLFLCGQQQDEDEDEDGISDFLSDSAVSLTTKKKRRTFVMKFF